MLETLLFRLRSYLASRVRRDCPLPCHEVVHRAILRKGWVKADGTVGAEAFLLRPRDQGRLSVCRRALGSWAECQRHFNRTFGAARLRVGRVHALREGIRVVADPEPDRPEHASLLNLPDPLLDPERAERVASLLMAIARRVV